MLIIMFQLPPCNEDPNSGDSINMIMKCEGLSLCPREHERPLSLRPAYWNSVVPIHLRPTPCFVVQPMRNETCRNPSNYTHDQQRSWTHKPKPPSLNQTRSPHKRRSCASVGTVWCRETGAIDSLRRVAQEGCFFSAAKPYPEPCMGWDEQE